MMRYWILLALTPSAAVLAQSANLYDMTLEELMDVEVISTAKFSRAIADIPTAVTILEKQDIDAFGWSSLSDALRTLQGVNVTTDYSYTYAGFRGVSGSGDYRSRVQVLVDGSNLNENIYGSVNLDSAFQIDMNMVERIEIIRGPSASVYGSSSMFGVINVITRKGAQINGSESRLALGSGKSAYANSLWGRELASGLDLSASVTVFEKDGQTGFFPELAAANEVASIDNIDAEEGYKISAQLQKNGLRSSLSYMQRDKIIPNGSYGTIIGDLKHTESDSNVLFETGYEYNYSESNVWDNRFYYGHYQYHGYFPYDYEPDYVINYDDVDGQWWGFESRWQSQVSEANYLTTGFEFRDNFRQEQENGDLLYGCYELGDVNNPCFYNSYRSSVLSLYLQDEWAVTESLKLTMGVRYDELTDQDGQFSPRLGIVYNHQNLGLFKSLYSEAYRNPNPYELSYNDPIYWGAGLPDIKPEHMRAHELTWEKVVFDDVQLLVSAYQFGFDHFIEEGAGGFLINERPGRSSGLEIAVQKSWPGGMRLRGNFSLQNVDYDDVTRLSENVPESMLKINLVYPVPAMSLLAGIEFQATSSRNTFIAGNSAAGYGLVNLNVGYRPGNAWEVKASVKDVFDRAHADPIASDSYMFIQRDRVVQLGRIFKVEFSLFFD